MKHPLSINQTDNPRIIAKSLPVVWINFR
jgi:hypothetical protein